MAKSFFLVTENLYARANWEATERMLITSFITSHDCYTIVTDVTWCHMIATIVTWLSHDVTIVTWCHNCHMIVTIVTWLSHDCHTIVTWLSHDSLLRERMEEGPHCIFQGCVSAVLGIGQRLQHPLNLSRPVPPIALLLGLELIVVRSVAREGSFWDL